MAEEVHVKCEPETLLFKGPYDKRQQSTTTVTNDGKKRIALKIRTSDNSLFKVNMVYAFMDPGANKQLIVRCNPFDFDANKTYNHRIAVVYTAADDSATNPQELWKTAKDVKEVMMKVDFKPADASAPADGAAPAPPADGAAPPAPPADGAAPPAPPADGAAPPAPPADGAAPPAPPADGAAPPADGAAPPAPPADGANPPADGGAAPPAA